MKQTRSILAWVLTAALMLSMLFIIPLQESHATDVEGLAAVYASYQNIKTLVATDLMSLPDSSSEAQASLTADTMLTVLALCETFTGEYWYQVSCHDQTLYVRCEDTAMIEQLTDDVAANELMTPAALGIGDSFSVGGTIRSTYNELGKVTASVYEGSYVYGDAVISAVGTGDSGSYSLADLSSELAFEALSAGAYTFLLSAEVISYYIDGSGLLSTVTKTVIIQRKPFVITDAKQPNQPTAMGVDVSEWNGTINWANAAQEIDFAILCTGYGNVKDEQFAVNATGCVANGVPFGVYHILDATTVEEAAAEAELVIECLVGFDPQLPVYLDIEQYLLGSMTSEQLCSVARSFFDIINAAGYETGLYTYSDLLDAHFTDAYFSTLPKWVSQPGGSCCSYTDGVTMWQYSWDGKISGISTDVDCNYCYTDLSGVAFDCSHTKWKYAYANGSHTATCMTCGDLISSEASDGKELKLNSVSLELANNINVIYSATIPDGFRNPYLVFDFNGMETVVSECTISDNGRYCFHFEGVLPQFMGDTIDAVLYATYDGTEVSCTPSQYSVRRYCVSRLGKNPSEAFKNLLSDLLVYGEKAQIYAGYKTDQLVTDGLELTPSTFIELDESYFKQTVEGTENQVIDLTSVSLSLTNTVQLRFRVTSADPSAYTYQVTMDGRIWTYTFENLRYEDGSYYLYFSEFDATRFDREVTAVILLNGQQVSRTVTTTVNSYIYNKQYSENLALREILQAIFNYGRSAEQYIVS